MILGDLGARVIKIERPKTGDDTRHWRPPAWNDHSTLFLSVNRNKESITLDIDTDAGVKVVKRLAGASDVMVESSRTGSMHKRGLGYKQIRTTNSRLVYCSISGFGSKGPQSGRAGYDAMLQAYSGIMSITGEPKGSPVRAGPSVIDMGAGIWAALGLLAALRDRDATGKGKHVEISLLETGIAWMSYFATGYFGDGTVPERSGTRHALIAPYEGFATLDGDIFLGAANDNLFQRLCNAVEMPELSADERFKTNPDRLANRDELHHLLESRLRMRKSEDWERILSKEAIPCTRIQTVDQLVQDPQVIALDIIRSFKHPKIDNFRLVDHPISYDGVRSYRQDPPPELGEHSESVLRSFGYDEAELEKMRKDGIIG
jgi:crotonobetainyl-CoA:carnitine CoA-transferase CaiB-like acyl-CoA transferase